MIGSFEEILGVPLLFSWGILQPVITLFILNGAKILSRRLSRLAEAIESGSVKFWSQIFAAVLLLLVTLIKNYLTREPSFFATENVLDCSDITIKTKFKQFIKANHPDKTGISTEEFGLRKNMFEILKDAQKCRTYDVFGLELGDVKKFSKTEKESFDHYLIDAGIFYAFCVAFFILVPFFSRGIDELLETFLIISAAFALESDGIFLHRNGTVGQILNLVSKVVRPMSISELRSLIRSYVMPMLVFTNNIRPIICGQKPSSPEERRDKLRYIYSTLKKIKVRANGQSSTEAPHTFS